MQPKTTEQTRSVEEAVFSRLGDALSIPRLALLCGVPLTTIAAYRYGRARCPAELFPKLYRAIRTLADPGLAAWAVERLARLDEIGHGLHLRATGTDGDAPATDALQASHWLGEVSAQLAAAGLVDHQEAASMLPFARRLEVEAGQLRVKLELIAACSPQRSIPGAEARP